MRFGNLEYLTLLWILPAMILLAVYAFRKKDRMLRLFADTAVRARLMPEASRRRQVVKFLLLLAGVALLLTALLGPRWGFHWHEIERRGVDILVAVDVSGSMLAEDARPNRLERARREVADLLGLLKGDRVGLIAFAGAAFLQCPLTLDRGAFSLFLDYLDTDLIPVPGSDVGAAIQTAMDAFVPGRRASRALILISDGEDLSGDVEKKAEEAKKRGIRIFTVGVGSPEGAPIPALDGSGGFHKDRRGEVVLTRLDESTLRKMALITGGSHVRSVPGDENMRRLYEDIRSKVEAGELQTMKQKRWEERFQWFLFAGLLLFCLEAMVSERRRSAGTGGPPWWRRPGFPRSLGLLLVPALVLLILGSVSPAAAEPVARKLRQGEKAYQEERYDEALRTFLDVQVERPEDVLLRYNIGQSQYRVRNWADAESAFRDTAVSGDPALEQASLYNLGNTAYRQGKLDEAVAYYQQALERDPGDEDARFNLEFVREEIKRRIEEDRRRREEEDREQQAETCPDTQKGQQGQEEEQQQAGREGAEDQPDPQPAQPDETQEGGPQEPPAAPGEEHEAPETGEAASAAAATPDTADGMSPEEADRWLHALEEDPSGLIKEQARRALGHVRPTGDKDW